MDKPSLPYFVFANDPPAKRSIVLSAMELFATHGVDGVTVRDIAAHSGFSNPAIFKHYKTKDELARSLFKTCYACLASIMLAPAADLRQVIADALNLIEASPDSVHFVLENLRRFWRDMRGETQASGLPGAMRRLIERAQAAGQMRPGIDAQLAAALVLGMLAQITRMAHFGELSRRPTELAQDIFDLIDGGLGV